MSDNSEQKLYSITEVSSMLQVPQHVLRLWESQFDAIVPTRGRNGRRYYDGDAIQAIKQVQELVVHQGLDLDIAKQQLAPASPSLPFMEAENVVLQSAAGENAGIDRAKLQQVLLLLDRAAAALER